MQYSLSDFQFSARNDIVTYTTYSPTLVSQLSNQRLKLDVKKIDGLWQSSGVLGPTLGYGTYTLEVQGRLDTLDPNVVFAIWLYNDLNKNELDIVEASRWRDQNAWQLLSTTAYKEGRVASVFRDAAHAFTKYKFECQYFPDKTVCISYGDWNLSGGWKEILRGNHETRDYGQLRLGLWVNGTVLQGLNTAERGLTSVTISKLSFQPYAPPIQ